MTCYIVRDRRKFEGEQEFVVGFCVSENVVQPEFFTLPQTEILGRAKDVPKTDLGDPVFLTSKETRKRRGADLGIYFVEERFVQLADRYNIPFSTEFDSTYTRNGIVYRWVVDELRRDENIWSAAFELFFTWVAIHFENLMLLLKGGSHSVPQDELETMARFWGWVQEESPNRDERSFPENRWQVVRSIFNSVAKSSFLKPENPITTAAPF